MPLIRHVAAAFLLLFATAAAAQQWTVSPVGETGFPVQRVASFAIHDSAQVDASGNLFIAGSQYSVDPNPPAQGIAGIFLAKYAVADGHEIWRLARPGSTGVDGIAAVAIDPSGDAFVVGTVHDPNGDHMLVARVNGATGAMMWQAGALTSDGNPSATNGFDIALDASGHVFALGTQRGTAVVAKIDAGTGDILGQALPAADRFAGSQDPVAIRIDANGNVVGVTFVDNGSASELFKLSGTDGARIWATPWTYRINTPGGPEIRDFAVDPAGNPAIAGRGVAKFSGATGAFMWERAPFGNGFPGTAWGITTAANGDVVATGTTGNSSEFMITMRLAAATGTTIWDTAPGQFDFSRGGQIGKGVALNQIGDTVVGAQVLYPDSTNFELQLLEMDRDGVVRAQSPRFAFADGTPQADLVLNVQRTAYLLGRVTPPSGPTRTIAIKYAEQHKLFTFMSIASSANPSIVGQPVTLTATLQSSGPIAPTGTVLFRDVGTPIPGCESVPLVNNSASCTTTGLGAGQHDLGAVYGGDANYAGSFVSIRQTVNNAPPSIALTSSVNPSNFEQAVTFTATVTAANGAPSGTVDFRDNGTAFAGCIAAPLVSGVARCTIDGLMPGAHAISAAYPGDATFGPGVSATLSQSIQTSPPAMAAAWQVSPLETPPLTPELPVRAGNPGPHSAVDSAGNLFVALNSSTPDGATRCMDFIKYAVADGHVAWRRDICNAANTGTFTGGIAVDANGDAIVTGIDAAALFVAKLAGATGATVWQQHIASSSANPGVAIGLDAAGNARVAASGFPLTIYAFANASGALQWQTALDTGLGGGSFNSFAVDAAGGVAAGDRHTIDTRENVNDVLTRIDASGNVTWRLIRPGGFGPFAFDASGNVFAGSFSGLQKFAAADGSILWTFADGGSPRVDAQGNVFSIANAAGSTINTAKGLVVAKLDGDGHLLWSHSLVEDPLQPLAASLAVDTGGNLLLLADGSDQEVMKFDGATGHMLWMARDTSNVAGGGLFPLAIHATPTGAVTFGMIFANRGEVGPYAIAYSDAVTPPPPPPPPQPSVVNLSTRGEVLTGNDVMIAGFVIGGSAPKTVVITAAGPSLASAGIANPLVNPAMTLVRSSDGAVIATNDDWQAAANAADIQAAGFAPADAREPAIMMTLPPGAYTSIVSGVGNTTGVAVVGVFEVDHPEVPLINISTRGEVLTGNDVMIGGFVIQGTTPQTVVITGIGPSLTQAGIANALANPTLTLVRSSDQSVVASNDDWGSAPNAAAIQASGLAPADARESAIMVTLDPGAYTAILSGAGGGTGVGIVAVYRP